MGATQRPPAGLGRSGGRLWRDVVEAYELTPAERALLLEACRTADELDTVRKELLAGPVVVRGSTGQPRPSGLLAEARAHRLVLGKLLDQLALPAEGEDIGLTPAQERARKAAQVRWSLKRDRSGGAA